ISARVVRPGLLCFGLRGYATPLFDSKRRKDQEDKSQRVEETKDKALKVRNHNSGETGCNNPSLPVIFLFRFMFCAMSQARPDICGVIGGD
ncbi:MAG: hypothetical protein SPK31_04155, partial [Alloprevotella sp.]|nr:hypothetical protein [Prevotellamassilia sp.]MDY5762275.1 hypothetical protein [Alloprevotella sp.]